MRFIIELCDWCRPRLILGVGPVSEQTGPVVRNRSSAVFVGPVEILVSITLTDSQQCVLTVKGVDKKGNPSTVTGAAWFVDNTDLLGITDNGDGTAVLKAVGPLGKGTVSVKASVGGGDVAGSADVTIVAGAPTTLTIDAGAPTDQP